MANKLLPFPSTSPPAVSVVAEQAPSSSAMENQTSDPPQRLRMPYYTPVNPRQFSSSAAKRESVMALGSIAHLQHYFVRNGLATKNRSASHRNMILAVPGRDPNQLSEEDEEVLQNLPPEPAPPPPKPSQPQFPAGRALPNLTDLESARQEVMAHPANISNLGGDLQRRMSHLELSTAARPRISRSTFLGSSQRASSPSRNEPPALISRRSATGFDPFALFKKRAVSGPMMSYANSQTQTAKDDPLAILRKMSLEVLTCLKDIEHKFRIPGSATPMDNQEFSIFQSSDQHQRTSPPQQHSLAETKIVEQDEDNSEGSLILPSMSWEYRQDVSLEEVRKEALVVKEWLECVDGILEGMKIITGSRRKKSHLGVKNQPTNMKKKSGIVKDRNVFKKIINSSKFSTSNNAEMKVPDISLDDGTMTEDESYSEMEDEEDSEELLPDWARNDRFLIKSSRTDDQGNPIDGLENDPLGRLFSCLVSHLPHELLSHLVPPHGEFGSRIGFLDSLSDGTLLCLAYNTVLRKSQRPWGFIPVESIHNLVTLTGGKGSSGGGGSTSMVMSPEMGSERSLSKSSMGAIDEQESVDGEDRLRSPGSFGVHSRFPTHTGSDSSFSTPFSPSISGDSVASSSHTATQSNPNHLKVGLTFRRMENIKVWAAALKLRYLIKGEIPLPKTKTFDQSTPPNSQPHDPTSPPNPTIITATNTNNNSNTSHDSGSIVKFDPKMIAKKSDGWDLALVYMASKWLDSIKAEKREEVLFSK
ncbi:uncharacterized protein PGTG_13882 [Puccinia graminis f. sp. tritici CRL 75-36-700-3]|uniref:Calponin-homology (CH) domain-containing protein n=1 Tax=Puccinia graminis f. sp. tritici (strain CRL 75-36-700-3 / race SCCL) TaxID=418459 RepID=E3KT86_PUCGT|nr:uncharacterized protein PGTG_13882 [Puccinia graminis f. sp. tritici CRL 75-36-700-3]EFP87511.1 hypothetical protein PGTG_13882 [Puccinia graminis f. sp. tritici CRL 75-36-700-3]